MPTASSAVTFAAANSKALISTFVIAWVWFARVVAPFAVVMVPSEPQLKPTTNEAGLFLATGSPSLLHLQQPLQTATGGGSFAANKKETAASWRFNDLGLALAVGSPSLVHQKLHYGPLGGALPALPEQPQPETADLHAFVLTCALVHTLLVGVGLAFGADSDATAATDGGRSAMRMLACTIVLCFGVLCVCLSLSWEFNTGPVPPVAVLLGAPSKSSYVLYGALEATGWLGISALLETSAMGRTWIRSPLLTALTALGGGMILLFDASVTTTLACMIGSLGAPCGAAAWLAAQKAHTPNQRSWLRQVLLAC